MPTAEPRRRKLSSRVCACPPAQWRSNVHRGDFICTAVWPRIETLADAVRRTLYDKVFGGGDELVAVVGRKVEAQASLRP